MGGETGGMSPSTRENLCKMCLLGKHHPGKGRDACTGLLKPCGKNAGRMGVLGMLMVPGCQSRGGTIPAGDVWGTPAARGAQAAGKRCSCMASLYRFAEPERGAIAGSHLCSCPQEHPQAAGVRVGPYLWCRRFQDGQKAEASGGPVAAQWELHFWWCRDPFCLLVASRGLLFEGCLGGNVGAPCVPPHPQEPPQFFTGRERAKWGEPGVPLPLQAAMGVVVADAFGWKLWSSPRVRVSLVLVRLGGKSYMTGVLGWGTTGCSGE